MRLIEEDRPVPVNQPSNDVDVDESTVDVDESTIGDTDASHAGSHEI